MPSQESKPSNTDVPSAPAETKTAEFDGSAPKQQIAPVSANGDNTSARSAPQADVPANAPATTGVSSDDNSADAAKPPVQESTPVVGSPVASEGAAVQTPEAPEGDPLVDAFGKPLGAPEEVADPIVAANNLLKTAPGRMRIY